jgi:hypothetical protein
MENKVFQRARNLLISVAIGAVEILLPEKV